MITIDARTGDVRTMDVDVVAVGVFKGGIEGPGAPDVLRAIGLDDFPITTTFRGDEGQTLRLASPGQPFRSVLLVGMGRMDAVGPALLRRVAGVVARATPDAASMATTLAEVHPTRAAIAAVAEGLRLGSHRDTRFRGREREDSPTERRATLLVPSSMLSAAEAAIARAAVTTEAVAFARDLVNTPPGKSQPEALADAVAAAMPEAVTAEVHDIEWLRAHGCGGLLGVGREGASPPRLVELTYEPPNPLAHVVLAGKGITFDSGGLNLKPSKAMMTMKADMAGAAAVAAAMQAVGRLGAPVAVTGLLALAENAIGGDAQRTSDVITTFNGVTVEVTHTDAEGRLVLADALGYAASMEPDAIIDVATLTGAVVTALGPHAAGAMGDDEDLMAAILAAAEVAGEPLWRLPLWPWMDRQLESLVADVDNIGKDTTGGGAIVGGLFLRRFVGDVPWVHLDIGGPAFLSAEAVMGHMSEGGTGFGVSTLIAFLEQHTG